MKNLNKLEIWLFYLLVFFLPLQVRTILYSFRPQFNEWTSVYFYATDFLAISVIFLWLARKFKEELSSIGRWSWAGNWQSLFRSIGMASAIFLLISGFSVLASGNVLLSLYGFLKLLEFIGLFLYVRYNFRGLFKPDIFWRIFIGSACWQSAVAIVQFFKQKSLGLKIFTESPLGSDVAGVAKIVVDGEKIVRAYGLLPHPNILAAILIFALFGLAFLFVKNYAKLNVSRKIIFAAIFGLLFLALFLTFSRAAAMIGLSALAGWLIWLFFKYKEYRRPAWIVFLSLLAGSFLLSVVFWPYISARYDVGDIVGSQAFDLRVFYNKMGLALLKANPIFGAGLGVFVWMSSTLNLFQNWIYQPIHNIYLLIAAETGALGLLAFLWFLFLIFWRSIKGIKISYDENKIIISCFLFLISSFLIMGLFDHFFWTLQQGQLMFWILLGIIAGISPHSSTDRARPSEG
jgi:O-antigen ligase